MMCNDIFSFFFLTKKRHSGKHPNYKKKINVNFLFDPQVNYVLSSTQHLLTCTYV